LLANCVGVPIFPLRLLDPLCAFLEIHHSTLFHAKAQSTGEGDKEKRNPEIYRRIFGGSAQLKDRLQSAQLQRGRDDKRLALFATATTSDGIFEIAPIRRLIKGRDVLFQELLFSQQSRPQ
jgi:hypothetical protein